VASICEGNEATVGCAVRASKVRIVQECNLQVRASKVPHDESKYFTDKLGPLKRWLDSQVGRNWDGVYSEIRQVFPNTNKKNHHLLDTHLMGYINRNVAIEKSRKGRRVFSADGYAGRRELGSGEIYVDLRRTS
jgi:hypothetical protein